MKNERLNEPVPLWAAQELRELRAAQELRELRESHAALLAACEALLAQHEEHTNDAEFWDAIVAAEAAIARAEKLK